MFYLNNKHWIVKLAFTLFGNQILKFLEFKQIRIETNDDPYTNNAY